MSPQRHIPRKPHPNGLVNYTATTKTFHEPCLIDLEPDYIINDPKNTRSSLIQILFRWIWSLKPYVTIDAGFPGADIVCAEGSRHYFHDLDKFWAQEGLLSSPKVDLSRLEADCTDGTQRPSLVAQSK